MTTKIDRRSTFALAAGLAMAPVAGAAAAGKEKAMPLPDITIYHVEGRRSERIVWLMEELDLPYKLQFTRGNLAASMLAIREINPVVPMAPTIKYGDQVMVESGGIVETIVRRHGGGRLQPALESPDFPAHQMFMHYAEGSLAVRLFGDYAKWMTTPPTKRSPLVDSEAVVQFSEDHLKGHPWFGGAGFSGADIMMYFPLNLGALWNIYDASLFPKVADWKARIEARPAFKRMLAKARPDGLIGMPPPLKQHAPSGPRPPLVLPQSLPKQP